MQEEQLMLQAVANYILYRTTNYVRHRQALPGTAKAAHLSKYMDQMLHEATRDDGRLRQCCGGQGFKRKASSAGIGGVEELTVEEV